MDSDYAFGIFKHFLIEINNERKRALIQEKTAQPGIVQVL
jgi:hypothetical protein